MTTPSTTAPRRPQAEVPAIQWLSSQQTADMLGVHINHLRTIPPARLPYYNMAGRLRRYRLEDIEKFLADSRIDQ